MTVVFKTDSFPIVAVDVDHMILENGKWNVMYNDGTETNMDGEIIEVSKD